MKTREKSFTLLTLLILTMAILMLSCKKDDELEEQDQLLGMIIVPSQFEATTVNYILFC